MFPLGHATFGYLLYALFALLTRHRLPYGVTLASLLVGTQLADIVDKPLAFFGVLPSGRALGHSQFFAAGLVALLWLLSRRYDCRHLTVPFGFGHLAHLFGDVVVVPLSGSVSAWELRYLLWPLFPAPRFTTDEIAPWIRIVRYYQSPGFTPELLLIPVAFVTFLIVEHRRRRITPK